MIKRHFIFLVCLAVYILLLAKNPFSIRTLIPNLEPYPDAIHYTNPALNLAKGNGFYLKYKNNIQVSHVPPLYSLILVPFFLIFKDVRMFYIANVVLSVFSFFLFYLILRNILEPGSNPKQQRSNHPLSIFRHLTSNSAVLADNIVMFLSLFLYVTNYFIYWYPTLAMGEHLILFLTLLGIYMLMKNTRPFSITAIIFISVAIFAAKSANIPVSAFLLFGLFLKAATQKEQKNKKIKTIILSFFGCITLFSIYFVYSQFHNASGSILKQTNDALSGSSWFSFAYIKQNFFPYIRALLGNYKARFLWDNTPLIPMIIGVPAFLGLFIAIRNDKYRIMAITLLGMIVGNILLLSTFYSFDMRYLYHLIPILFIGNALFWSESVNLFVFVHKKTETRHMIKTIVLSLLLMYYIATNIIRLKTVISINFRYSETPWYYVSVQNLNNYFRNNENISYVISAQSPYFIDMYATSNILVLPMSKYQDFFDHPNLVWGSYDYKNLKQVYQVLLRNNKKLYLQSYFGNDQSIKSDFETIRRNFLLEKVQDGCYGSCDIFKLSLK